MDDDEQLSETRQTQDDTPAVGRDIIIISRPVDRQLHYDLSRQIQSHQKHQRCTVFLTTRGGDPDGGYRIGRCLRHHYEHVRLVIPSYCKSAGTLIAIAADEMAIGDFGELGPLDVQVRKHNEMAESSSGLDFNEAVSASFRHVMYAFRYALVDIRRGTRISTRLAGEFATNIAASVAAPLYSQIDPHRVGEMQRAITIAIEYGTRLNEGSGSLKSINSLYDLVTSYPSHSFVIDRKEAGNLFKNVGHPSELETRICETLWPHLQDESDYGPVVWPGNEAKDGENDEQDNEGDDRDVEQDDIQPDGRPKDGAEGPEPQGCQGRGISEED